MTTLEDIAQALDLSKSTVSKALTGARDVSRKTRLAVLEKAVELGYDRVLRTTEPTRIAVFITRHMEYARPEDLGHDIIVGFRQAAEPAGYQVTLIPLDRELQQMRYDEYMVMGNYRGALILGISGEDPWMAEFESCRTPTVLYDNRICGNPNVTTVGVDNSEGIRLAIAYLQGLGHRRIGCLTGSLEARVYRQRYDAFVRAMYADGLQEPRELCASDEDMPRNLGKHLPRLLEAGCSAIVCSHDKLAQALLEHCQGRGLRVPEDISIVGFDDLPLCSQTRPALTTIRQKRTALGKSAFYALSCHWQGVAVSTHLLHPELVRRDSCAAPRGGEPGHV